MPAVAFRAEVAQGLRPNVAPETDEVITEIALAKELGIPVTKLADLPVYWREGAYISLRSRQLIRDRQLR